MGIEIRDVSERDLPQVLALNEQAVPQVNRLEIETIQWFANTAAFFRVAKEDGRLLGSLVAVANDGRSQSEYFEWFCARFSNFIYIDRIAVAEESRGERIAWSLFEDVAKFPSQMSCLLTSDVYCSPPSEISLAFHEKYGFQRVGVQTVANGREQWPSS